MILFLFDSKKKTFEQIMKQSFIILCENQNDDFFPSIYREKTTHKHNDNVFIIEKYENH